MDEKLTYPPRHYQVHPATVGPFRSHTNRYEVRFRHLIGQSRTSNNKFGWASITERWIKDIAIRNGNEVSIYDAGSAFCSSRVLSLRSPNVAVSRTIWSKILAVSAIFLGLTLIALCIVIPVSLAPVLTTATSTFLVFQSSSTNKSFLCSTNNNHDDSYNDNNDNNQ